MDRLDRILDTAGPLLRKVDAALGDAGAPAEHAVWGALRRVRLLPGDAVRAVAALRPSDLAEASPELLATAGSCATLASELPPPGDWSGTAADAYDRARLHVAEQLSTGPDSLGSSLHATADLADNLIAWMQTSRDAVADALAEALVSTEAVALLTDNVDSAAPDLAVLLLQAVADAYDRGTDLLHRSAELAFTH
ncbi:hypothetical protein GCM10010435_44730 [Winogradskya consettensis]|uniref:Uncharacterized protein n=1 Tax=Winogradskya consettensis TaxID=113560 RepID=A0A919T2T6_9ACTN|nr:hypothetical protein [Actinoplanes consettensis]GIM82758.1 hypothetical protein Aco04nite_83120 [Actinoplanes consettensis]